MQKIWNKYYAKSRKNRQRCERLSLNWPIHAEVIINKFQEISNLAEKNGVSLKVDIPEFLSTSNRCSSKQLGNHDLGASVVSLRFGMEYTGEGLLARTIEGEVETHYIEIGARLDVRFSPSLGAVEVYFWPSRDLNESRQNPESIPFLYTYTFDTDDVVNEWVENIVSAFLVFNRHTSRLERSSTLDNFRVRYWRFKDIRNRRGYLSSFQHILTTWELLVLAAILGIPTAFLTWAWDKIALFW